MPQCENCLPCSVLLETQMFLSAKTEINERETNNPHMIKIDKIGRTNRKLIIQTPKCLLIPRPHLPVRAKTDVNAATKKRMKKQKSSENEKTAEEEEENPRNKDQLRFSPTKKTDNL